MIGAKPTQLCFTPVCCEDVPFSPVSLALVSANKFTQASYIPMWERVPG